MPAYACTLCMYALYVSPGSAAYACTLCMYAFRVWVVLGACTPCGGGQATLLSNSAKLQAEVDDWFAKLEGRDPTYQDLSGLRSKESFPYATNAE